MALRILVIAVGLVVVAFLLAAVLRSKRRLDQRVEQHRAEMAESGGRQDPWQALADLYAENERLDRAARARKPGDRKR